MELYHQAYTFAVTILTGALLAILFDFYRAMRTLVRPRPAVDAAADLFYWLLATAVTIVALLMCNWLELRFYVFLGLVCGAVSYFRFFSRYAIFLFIRLLRYASYLTAGLRRFACFFLVRPLCIGLRMLLLPLRTLRRILAFVWRWLMHWFRSKDIPRT